MSTTAPATFQRRFEFHCLMRSPTPLLSIQGLREQTGLFEDSLLYMIEDGQLPFCFDIAMPGTRRAMDRVWRGSHERPGVSLEDVIEDILGPALLPTLNVSTLRRRWACSATHVHHLIEAGLLAEVGGENRKQTNTRNVTRLSAETFLKLRRKQ